MNQNIKPPLPSSTLAIARELQKQSTDAELRLWHYFRAKRTLNLKWRRQHPIPPCVVDFYCHQAKLAVELDGGQHEAEVDLRRTTYIRSQGIEVIRFWNHDVLSKTETVMDEILRVVQMRTLSPSPSPGGRGEKS
ncbi:MAG: endonuclease domain-containing protein [Arenimonas sp.]